MQLLVSAITHQEKHVAQRLFLEDIETWKLTFLVFAFFAFSTLHDFSEKTYEKACCLHNIIVFSLIYLQLPVSTITHQEKDVSQRLFLEDIGTWKLTFFLFVFFVFSNLHDFSEKTYEKDCCLRRSTISMTYFESSFHFVHVYILWSSEIFCKKCCWSLKILINYYFFLQLWALFVAGLIKTLTIFTTHSPLSYKILQKFQLYSNN